MEHVLKQSAVTLAFCLATLAGTAVAADPREPPEKMRCIRPPARVVPMRKTRALPSVAVPNGRCLASCQNLRTEGDLVTASSTRRDGGRRDTAISV